MRPEPQIQWFLDSIRNECGGDYTGINLIVIAFHADEPWKSVSVVECDGEKLGDKLISYMVYQPKPCVWQGPHRLTKQDWFAASNARNTGLCYARDGWIAYVDDLSVLMPGWLNAVREAMAGNYIVLGAYKKVKNLVVENGVVRSCWEFAGGLD